MSSFTHAAPFPLLSPLQRFIAEALPVLFASAAALLRSVVLPASAAALLFAALPSAGAATFRWKVLPTRPGPRVTDAEFFAALDLDRPGLSDVRAAVEKGDLDAAKTALCAYFEHRSTPVLPAGPFRKNPAFDTKLADEAVRHIVRSDLIRPDLTFPMDSDIDWTFHPETVNDREWTWVLNRHDIWVQLARAYAKTGDEKYAREFNRQVISWVHGAQVPEKSAGVDTPSWRTIEAGIRIAQTWMPSYVTFLHSPSFTTEGRMLFYKSILEHARFLERYPSGGNWLTMEMNGLAHAGVLFPEFKEAKEWRDFAYNRLAKELEVQVYPDGAQFELTTGYHKAAMDNMLGPVRLAMANNIPLPPNYLRDLERMYNFVMYMAYPNIGQPAFSDSDPAWRTRAETLSMFPAGEPNLLAGADLFRREDMRYVATGGRAGTPPAETSHAFPYAGFYVMRSGWDKDARYLAFDAGPFGAGHQHEDKLSFDLMAYDRNFIVDPGRYSYAGGAMRAYFLGPASHSTIMVDGLGQNRRAPGASVPWVVKEPLPHEWVSLSGGDYAEGTYDEGYGPKREVSVRHRRGVLFVKPGYWVIIDRVEGEGRHKIESLLHFAPIKVDLDAKTGVLRTADVDRANLTVTPLGDGGMSASIVQGQKDPIQGWDAPGYNEVVPAPVAVYSAEAALPFGMGLVLYPSPAGAATARVTPVPVSHSNQALSASDAVACRVVDGANEDSLMISLDVSKPIKRWEDFYSNGRATVVRRSNGRLAGATLIEGTRLWEGAKGLITLDAIGSCDVEWTPDTAVVECPNGAVSFPLFGQRHVQVNGVTAEAPAGSSGARFEDGRITIFPPAG